MRTGRPTKELVLQAEEKAKLELMARRPKTDQRTAQRARIVRDCAAGLILIRFQDETNFGRVSAWQDHAGLIQTL